MIFTMRWSQWLNGPFLLPLHDFTLLWPQIFAIRSQVGTVHGRGLHIIRWLQDVHLRQASKWSNDSPNLQGPAAFDPPGIPIKFNQLVTSFIQLYNTTALPPCNVFGNGNSSKEVVTRDHHHANARSTGGNHWIRNAITWVLNGSECLWFIWFWFDSAWVSNLRIWTRYVVVSESASPVVGALTCPYRPLSSLPGRALWAGRLTLTLWDLLTQLINPHKLRTCDRRLRRRLSILWFLTHPSEPLWPKISLTGHGHTGSCMILPRHVQDQ